MVELLRPALHLALEVDQLPYVVRVHVLHAGGADLRNAMMYYTMSIYCIDQLQGSSHPL